MSKIIESLRADLVSLMKCGANTQATMREFDAIKDWTAFTALREQLAAELAAEGLEDYMRDRDQSQDARRRPRGSK